MVKLLWMNLKVLGSYPTRYCARLRDPTSIEG